MKNRRAMAEILLSLAVWQAALPTRASEVSRVLEPGKKLDDPRLGRQRTATDRYHPWTPATTKAEWEKQSRAIRERVLVATGLWPMPPKERLKPVIHGRIDRGDYTVEKVFFASIPGHYVSGNLYRPTKINGKIPGVLCPHGHWKDGRFNDGGERRARWQIDQGAEATMAGARYFLQARMVQLARLGCVVFHYDMVGYADSQPIVHGTGFTDAEAELRLQSALGLQTFNSIRALDFLLSQPEVDSKRIGVTGASGGGTQTMLLCAVDPRPTVSFPAVMVSTNMQGDCECEAADLLRMGINNVAIAALFAPKPLAMSGARDWTIDIETKGLPELKQIYALYGNPDNVYAKCFRQFGHNYNRVSREMMYEWFNAHLNLGQKSPIVEQDFWPIDPKDLTVFDADHPRPTDAKSAAELRKDMTAIAKKQLAELLPQDKAGVERYREVVGTAARVMFDSRIPDPEAIDVGTTFEGDVERGAHILKGIAARSDDKTRLPWVLLRPESFNGTAVLWIDGQGKSHLFDGDGKPTAQVRKLLDAGKAVVSVDLFLTGEFVESGQPVVLPKVDSKYAGHTYAYNRSVLANRVHDVLTAVGGLRKNDQVQKIELVGTGEAGPCVLLAAGLLGDQSVRDQVANVIADAHGLSFEKIPVAGSATFLSGALKYGGLGGLAALAAPMKLEVFGTEGIPADELAPLSVVYKASAGFLKLESQSLTGKLVVDRLTKEE
jgi:hypothetical protein